LCSRRLWHGARRRGPAWRAAGTRRSAPAVWTSNVPGCECRV